MAGCGGTHGAGTTQAAAGVPNPFRIVARYSPASLGLGQPLGLAVGLDGNVYVTDASDHVTVVSPAGKVLRRWGKTGSGPGEFTFADSIEPQNLFAPIAVSADGKVYVADRGNNRVEVFSSSGKFIRQFGSHGFGSGQFLAIWGLAVDLAGNVYVTDGQQGTISKFSPAGHFEWSFGGTTATNPSLRGGFALANVDAHGRVVAGANGVPGVNAGDHRIVYLDSGGHKVDAFGIGGYFRNYWGPCDITVDGQGDVAVESCPDAGQPVPGVPAYRATLLFDPTHRLIGAWQRSPLSDFVGPHFGPHGEIFAIGAEGAQAHPGGPIFKLKMALPGG
jgi:hypothetical protein